MPNTVIATSTHVTDLEVQDLILSTNKAAIQWGTGIVDIDINQQ